MNDFIYISYEQIRPADAFGKIMVNHFAKRNSAIKCVQHYPSIDFQKKRFLRFGWDSVVVKTIEEIWKYYINDSEMERLLKIEPFDEAAELMLKCLHCKKKNYFPHDVEKLELNLLFSPTSM